MNVPPTVGFDTYRTHHHGTEMRSRHRPWNVMRAASVFWAVLTRLVFASLLVVSLTSNAGATTGGDATVRMLGWDSAHSSVLVARELGGENTIVDLFAFDLQRERIVFARCETCADLGLGAAPRNAAERAYLAVLERSTHLKQLTEAPRSAWKEAGLELGCTSTQSIDPESGAHFRRQRCQLTAQGSAPAQFEFFAPSDWYAARLFPIPGHPSAALGWIVHTGVSELGYREHELVLAPSYPRQAVSSATFAQRYGSGATPR